MLKNNSMTKSLEEEQISELRNIQVWDNILQTDVNLDYLLVLCDFEKLLSFIQKCQSDIRADERYRIKKEVEKIKLANIPGRKPCEFVYFNNALRNVLKILNS